jgi:hypothetical protein
MKKTMLFASLGLSVVASAQQVHVNSSDYRPVSDAGTTVFGAKFKSDNTNWDFSLGNTGSTSNTANFIQAGIGNNAFIGARVFGFELEHRTGEGFIWNLTDKANNNTTTLSWGTFTTPPSGTNAATLNSIAPNRSFNALRIENRASGSGSQNIFSNLAFTSAATFNGSFFNGTMTPSTAGFNQIGTPVDGFSVQWLVSDTDLSSYDWKFTGDIQLIGGNNEALRMDIHGRSLQAVPEPGTMAALGLGIAAFLKRKRK